MKYKVTLMQHVGRVRREITFELSEAHLRERVLEPYEKQKAIVVAGMTVRPKEVERIRIVAEGRM